MEPSGANSGSILIQPHARTKVSGKRPPETETEARQISQGQVE
ncbi:rCG23955, isoform CRA_b [Rattus norvegicus]|uniref:RCG23955, isoform CRA_b n=1 Tax=Rattus norvegicus TaxID=10116 RepID=A6JVR9_RAT|nr:rCG23955, isoform CRA_b [Rattus norvegicus]